MASTADVRVGNAAIHSKLHVPEFSTRPLRKVFVIMSREAKHRPRRTG